MGQSVRDALAAKVLDELEHVEAQLADLGMLLLVDAPREHVDVECLRREEGRDLFADDEVFVVRQLQAALDRVVVCEGDVRHPSCLGETVDRGRLRIGLIEAQFR